MEVLERIITQFNPLNNQKPTTYMIFMGKGALPFTTEDANGIWSEWRNALPEARVLRQYPLKRGESRYGTHWLPERAKFYKLFEQFITFESKGLVPSVLYVYPDGTELKWSVTKSETIKSQRGPLLAKALKALKTDGDFALAGIVQYNFNDDPTLYKSTLPAAVTRQMPNTNALISQVQNLKVDTEFKVHPIITDKPLPYNVLDNFWYYYRNNSGILKAKYGAGPAYDSKLFEEYRNVYEQANLVKVFDHFTKLDGELEQDRLIMISFIYDIGEQHVLFRLGGKSAENQPDLFRFGVLPATDGTKKLISQIPDSMRAVIVAFYY